MLEALLHYCLFNVMYDPDVWEWKRNTPDNTSISIHRSNKINQEYLKHITSANKGSWQAERLSPDSNKSQAPLQSSPVFYIYTYIYIYISSIGFFRRLCQPKWIQNFDSKQSQLVCAGTIFVAAPPHRNQEKEVDRGHLKTIAILEGQLRSLAQKKAWSHIL